MNKQMVSIPAETARLIANVFLPRNERKMRGAAPAVVKAVTEFKRALSDAVTGATNK